MKRHRYGALILTTPKGRWYYSWELQIATFVLKGRQIEATTIQARTRVEAVRKILKCDGYDLRLDG